MSFLDAIILGIVEGITEFIPVSSTAHLMMTSRILQISQTEFLKSFEIIIQLGAIAAVLFIFGPRFIKSYWLWKKIIIAFIPTAVIGLLLYKIIKTYLIGNLYVAVWSLVIGGVILVLIELFIKKHPDHATGGMEEISDKEAFMIGIIQSLAIFPGISRSAATIVPALFFGVSRKSAAEFSFLLAVPTVAAAAGYDLIKNVGIIDGNVGILTVGFITSFIAAIVSIKLLLHFIQKYSYTSFGLYRILIAGLFFLVFLW